jgi:protein tyrosine phosphatase (PTP) superfamily phosphohydrolase (DUF442 family)
MSFRLRRHRALPYVTLALGLLGALLAPLALAEDKVPPEAKPAEAKPKTVGKDVGHMHNVHQVTPKFIRGSQPDAESDFAELAKMGVKVVVSVDGAKPDIESAHKHGMRYVHVPMGYDGPSRAQEVLLYKAFTTLEGPFYVHCHHGKHRGPAACAIGLMGVEGWNPAQIVEELGRAGTAKKYEGLYAFPAAFKTPTPEELAACPAEIPEVAPVPGFVDAMVHIDATWVRLGQVRATGWKSPPDHPDVSPKHEATIYAEHFRELARLDDVTKAHESMLKHARDSEEGAWELAKILEVSPVDAAKADAAYTRIERSCTDCHKQFRDTPRGREAR